MQNIFFSKNLQNATHKQHGVVLVIILLMIFILAGLAVTIAMVPTQDQRIAGNFNDQVLATQAANAAIAEAEVWITTNWINNQALGNTACGQPILNAQSYAISGYSTIGSSWWSSTGCSATNYPSGVNQAPIYIILYLGCDANNSVDLYQIIAQGVGASPTTIVFSEKTISKGVFGTTEGTDAGTSGALQVSLSVGPSGAVKRSYPLGTGMSFGVYLDDMGLFTPVTTGPNGKCLSGESGYAICQRNCVGNIRVGGYAANDTHSCEVKFGIWAATGDSSSIQLKDQNGNMQTMTCWGGATSPILQGW